VHKVAGSVALVERRFTRRAGGSARGSGRLPRARCGGSRPEPDPGESEIESRNPDRSRGPGRRCGA
jgi:hypothetical protein